MSAATKAKQRYGQYEDPLAPIVLGSLYNSVASHTEVLDVRGVIES